MSVSGLMRDQSTPGEIMPLGDTHFDGGTSPTAFQDGSYEPSTMLKRDLAFEQPKLIRECASVAHEYDLPARVQ